MITTLLSSPTFATFLLASIVLALTPGPAVVYIVTRTLSQGRTAGLASIGGIALGNLGNAALASFGLAALLAASAAACGCAGRCRRVRGDVGGYLNHG